MPNKYFTPMDSETKLWRYLDFTKFLSMLIESSLFFSRSDLLGDPWEGSYPRRNVSDSDFVGRAGNSKLRSRMRKTVHSKRVLNYINCWHMNECESAGMWKL